MILDLNKLFPVGQGNTQGPLPKQQYFLNQSLTKDTPKYLAYYGGYGSGKSLILCITVITHAVLHGGEWVIARQFMPELRRTTYKTFLELLPKELLVEHRVADAEVHIKSASGKPAVIYFVGLDSPEKLDSLNLSGAAIDEASQVSEEAFLKLQGRLRNPLGLRKMLLVGNPKGHDWVYRYFLKQDMFSSIHDKVKYKMIVAPSTENVHLPEGYVESMLASYSKERAQRDIYGSFDSFEGQVYNEFDRQLHVIKPFAIPKGWTRYVGIDHGYTNPTCWLWGAMDYDGNLYIYREFYQSEWVIEEIVKGFKEKYAPKPGVLELMGTEWKEIDAAYIDPSTKAVRGQTGASDWDSYLDYLPKKFPLLPAKNDVEYGIDRVKTYLKPHPTTGKPKLYFFDTCENLLDEISEYRYQELSPTQEGKQNQKEAPRKYHDHAVDALRYLIASRPEEPDMKKDLSRGKYPAAETAIQAELKRIKNPQPKDIFGDY